MIICFHLQLKQTYNFSNDLLLPLMYSDPFPFLTPQPYISLPYAYSGRSCRILKMNVFSKSLW